MAKPPAAKIKSHDHDYTPKVWATKIKQAAEARGQRSFFVYLYDTARLTPEDQALLFGSEVAPNIALGLKQMPDCGDRCASWRQVGAMTPSLRLAIIAQSHDFLLELIWEQIQKKWASDVALTQEIIDISTNHRFKYAAREMAFRAGIFGTHAGGDTDFGSHEIRNVFATLIPESRRSVLVHLASRHSGGGMLQKPFYGCDHAVC